MSRIKNHFFDEINEFGNFDDLYEDEAYSMYQPILESKATKKAAKLAAKDIADEIVIDDEPSNESDEYGFPL
jgi:hypothetical protein